MELSVSGISKKYGKRIVLKDISLEAREGSQVGIIGANGSGKSTLLSALFGIIKADGGSFLVDGVDILKNAKLRNSICALVPQECPLIEELNGWDNLRMWYDKDILETRLQEGFLVMLGIPELLKLRVSRMSGGMRKRLTIACAISQDPKVLLLDEPTASLDLECREIIDDYLKAFRADGGIVILATHDVREIEACDQLIVIKDGLALPVNFDGDVKKLMENF